MRRVCRTAEQKVFRKSVKWHKNRNNASSFVTILALGLRFMVCYWPNNCIQNFVTALTHPSTHCELRLPLLPPDAVSVLCLSLGHHERSKFKAFWHWPDTLFKTITSDFAYRLILLELLRKLVLFLKSSILWDTILCSPLPASCWFLI
jgi:hypothetical protein